MPVVHRLKKLHTLSERLASLGIMWTQLRASLISLNTIVLWWSEGFQRGPSIYSPWCRETEVSTEITDWSKIMKFTDWCILPLTITIKPPPPPVSCQRCTKLYMHKIFDLTLIFDNIMIDLVNNTFWQIIYYILNMICTISAY